MTKPYPYQKEGVRLISEFNGRALLADEMGLGKAQPVSEPVLTPKGWRPIGDLLPGDFVIGSNGKPTLVLGVFPQKETKVVKVIFSDGSWTRCSPDHLWAVRTSLDKSRSVPFRPKTIRQLLTKGLRCKPSCKRSRGNRRWYIPIINPVQYKKASLPIHPYILGVLLGDGHLSVEGRCTAFSPGDEIVPKIVEQFLPPECFLKRSNDSSNALWKITVHRPQKYKNPIREAMKSLGLCNGISSDKRFIPELYMRGSIQQRIDLLSGLLDTDGEIRYKDGVVCFGSVSKKLRDQTAEIIQSLGGIARKHKHRGKVVSGPHKGLKRLYYSITISLPENIVATKAWKDRWKPKTKYQPTRGIEKIIPQPDEKTVCIKVDAEDQLYATRNHIVTHNSLEALAWPRIHRIYPIVVVCPAPLKFNWEREALQHVGLRPEILSGMKPRKPTRFDRRQKLFIINYRILGAWLPFLKALKPQLVICDEGHYLKNQKAQRTKNVRKLCRGVPNLLILTGTPMTNRPAELYSLLKLLWPKKYKSFMSFGFKYCNARRGFRGRWEFKGATNLKELHSELLDNGMIRRRKVDVLPDLPPKIRTVVPLDLGYQHHKYLEAENDFLKWLSKKSKHRATKAKKALALVRFGYLKQLAAKLKFKQVIDWIDLFLEETDEKLAVFAIHKKPISILKKRFNSMSVVLDGSTGTSIKARKQVVDQFQRHDKTRLFIGQINTAGVGINITAACTGLFAELGYTPAEHLQVEDRLHRIGQDRGVNWYYLVANNTIETDLCKLVQKKQKDIEQAIDGIAQEDSLDIFDQLLSYIKERRRKYGLK